MISELKHISVTDNKSHQDFPKVIDVGGISWTNTWQSALVLNIFLPLQLKTDAVEKANRIKNTQGFCHVCHQSAILTGKRRFDTAHVRMTDSCLCPCRLTSAPAAAALMTASCLMTVTEYVWENSRLVLRSFHSPTITSFKQKPVAVTYSREKYQWI